ncbi:MAG: DUF3316 domain-containing protein [Muribaculaceae bacterium]|nr:DUF3316 domain-containing protein [Muribaculaceae bacterium]
MKKTKGMIMKLGKVKILLAFLLILIPLVKTHSQEAKESSRPVTGFYNLEIGGTTVKASYLSPLRYKGTQYSLSGSWSKAMPFNPEQAVMQFDVNADFSNLLNPAQTARMVGLNGEFAWTMSWRKRVAHNFQFTAGGGIDLSGGAYYLIRNSNNPVQAMANLSITLAASVSKHFKIGRLPVLVSDRVKLPSLGVFFCPGYGETYYEIYLGNHKGLAHAGWWGNNFRIDNLLSFTLDFGKTAMMLGYRLNVYTQWANNLNTKIITNSFVIGVIPGGIGLKKHRSAPESAIYSIY